MLPEAAHRPNVLWLTTHDINPHLGCYTGVWPGAEQARTPHLDRLAAQGIRFDQAIATAPVCAPSRSSVLTGCFPPSIGTMHMRTRAVPPPEVQLLPTYFRAAGYWTANSAFTDFQMDIPSPVYDEFGDASHWRHRPDPDQPFFLAVHSMTTHESSIYVDDDRYAELTADVTDDQRQDEASVAIPPYHPDTPVYRRAWARYLELVSQVDHWVGRWLAALEDDGLERDTIVVFWSDHGLGMPRAKRWASEAGLREPLIMRWPGRLAPGSVSHVVSLMDLAPTMLAMCGLPVPDHMQGQALVTDSLVPEADLNPYAFSGRDRMGEADDRSRSVRDDRFRYTRHFHPDRTSMGHCEYPDHLATWAELRRLFGAEAQRDLSRGLPGSLLTPLQRSVVAATKPAEELYDVVADPHEETNLASLPAFADDKERLAAALDTWLATVGDLGAIPETELLEQWRPGGHAPVVDDPRSSHESGLVSLSCETPGALIGWTDRPEGDEPVAALPPFIGYEDDHASWRLYTGPFAPPPSSPIRVKAWRIGWTPSQTLTIQSP